MKSSIALAKEDPYPLSKITVAVQLRIAIILQFSVAGQPGFTPWDASLPREML